MHSLGLCPTQNIMVPLFGRVPERSPWSVYGSLREYMWYMIVQKARSPSASRPWPPPAAAWLGLMAPRSASMALQASTPGELCGCARGQARARLPLRRRRGKAMLRKGNV